MDAQCRECRKRNLGVKPAKKGDIGSVNKSGKAGWVKSKFFNRSIRAAALRNAEALTHCAAIALCRPTGGGSQRETKKQASPIATKSSSKATKMSLTCNAATKRRRIS